MMWESSRQQNTKHKTQSRAFVSTWNLPESLFYFYEKSERSNYLRENENWVVLYLFFMKNALNTVAFGLIVLKYQWQRRREIPFYYSKRNNFCYQCRMKSHKNLWCINSRFITDSNLKFYWLKNVIIFSEFEGLNEMK